jgi:hypothetical protein
MGEVQQHMLQRVRENISDILRLLNRPDMPYVLHVLALLNHLKRDRQPALNSML